MRRFFSCLSVFISIQCAAATSVSGSDAWESNFDKLLDSTRSCVGAPIPPELREQFSIDAKKTGPTTVYVLKLAVDTCRIMKLKDLMRSGAKGSCPGLVANSIAKCYDAGIRALSKRMTLNTTTDTLFLAAMTMVAMAVKKQTSNPEDAHAGLIEMLIAAIEVEKRFTPDSKSYGPGDPKEVAALLELETQMKEKNLRKLVDLADGRLKILEQKAKGDAEATRAARLRARFAAAKAL
jgi:hypothetical protein